MGTPMGTTCSSVAPGSPGTPRSPLAQPWRKGLGLLACSALIACAEAGPSAPQSQPKGSVNASVEEAPISGPTSDAARESHPATAAAEVSLPGPDHPSSENEDRMPAEPPVVQTATFALG